MKVSVLRIGHRVFRDQRITTHCALVARVFGADEIIVSGETDDKLVESVRKVALAWGGKFKTSQDNWKNVVKKWKGPIVHLTMYGIPFGKRIGQIRKLSKSKDVLVIIGAEKVPREMYNLADYNISITNQPHSEVAALAVFLHELFKGGELGRKFKNARIKLIPQEKGKKVVHV